MCIVIVRFLDLVQHPYLLSSTEQAVCRKMMVLKSVSAHWQMMVLKCKCALRPYGLNLTVKGKSSLSVSHYNILTCHIDRTCWWWKGEGTRINLAWKWRVKLMMLYASLDFHSCFPDKFHSGPLTFSRQQVLSIFLPYRQWKCDNKWLLHFPTLRLQKWYNKVTQNFHQTKNKLTFHIYLHSVSPGK